MLEFNFAHRFPGMIWNTVVSPETDLVLIEARDVEKKQASFSALNYKTNQFNWLNKSLEEPWWVNLSGVKNEVVIFTVYLDTNNPDKKGVLAYSLNELTLLWWNNDFSISAFEGNNLVGFAAKFGLKELVLDIQTGKAHSANEVLEEISTDILAKPVQYNEGMEYFETVKTFLADRLNFLAINSLEYLETSSHIIISCYANEDGLANYLLVLSLQGELELKEKLDAPVKGIGYDTFFVLGRSLFFVKNKVELVSYTLL